MRSVVKMQIRKWGKLGKLMRASRRKGSARSRFSADANVMVPSIWQDFCDFTTLHGIKNIYQDFRYLNEALSTTAIPKKYIFVGKMASIVLWGGSLLFGSLLAITLTYWIYERSLQTPTLVTLDTYYYPTYAVPFPAVSICNTNVVYRPAMENMLKTFVDGGYNETAMRKVFSELNHLVGLFAYTEANVSAEMLEFKEAMDTFDYTVESLMLRLMQPCKSLLIFCVFLSRTLPCDKLFFVSKTTEGFCCSFNHKYLFNYKAYTQKNLSELYGYHSPGAGDNVGLGVIVNTEPDTYVSNKRGTHGSLIAVHQQEEFAELTSVSLLQPGIGLKNFVYPTIVTSDEAVRGIPFVKRKCLFPEEYPLKVSDKYTVGSCISDCRVRNFIELCGCIPFFYPHLALPEYATVAQCHFEHLPCLHRISSKMSGFKPPDDAVGFEEVHDKSELGISCDECFQTCTEVRYSVMSYPINSADAHDLDSTANDSSPKPDYASYQHVSGLFVGFYENICMKYRRTVFMPWDTMFANVGGAFGLCLGASIISFIEIVYFVAIRVFGRMWANDMKLARKQAPPKVTLPVQRVQHDFYNKDHFFGGYIR